MYKTKKLNRLVYLSLLGLLICLFSCHESQEKRHPNILFIMADDMGVEVLGSYGGKSYNTPNLDNLAETGTRFTNCHSTPACSPTRVKLLTGRYGFRTTQQWGYIPENEVTFGHILSNAGYKVAIAGKWQMALLKEDPNHIAKMGFPESAVFGWHEGPRYYEPLIYQNGQIKKDVAAQYGPDIFSDFLIDFIKTNKNSPFFAYYSMALAHDVSDDFSPPPPFGPQGRYDTYKEQVEYLDKMVGKMVKALEDLGIRENTLILFTADNGTPYRFITNNKNGEFIREEIFSEIADTLIQGGKTSTTDGGTHVPLIANWPGKVSERETNNDLIDFSDFLPTFSELTGSELPRKVIIDGISFAPQIFGEKGNPREWLYTIFKEQEWVRNKEWKLYRDGRMYDLNADPYELHPIKIENASKSTQEMGQYLAKIMADIE